MDRVLVIDDDDLMLQVLKEILEQDGYDVTTASSGDSGIKLYNELRHKLVITDLIMPHKDGINVISELKDSYPEIRIIAISGTPRLEKIAAAVAVNANRVIAKPFEQDELLDAVAELLDYTAPSA